MAESQMLLPHISRCKKSHKRRRSCSFLHVNPAASFLALYQAHRANHLKSELARRSDSFNSRSSAGADIIDNDDPRTLFAKALDPLTRTMLLLRFADEKPG